MQYPFKPSREEVSAQLLIIDRLFELASGAAIDLQWTNEITQPLVELENHIKEFLEWNVSST